MACGTGASFGSFTGTSQGGSLAYDNTSQVLYSSPAGSSLVRRSFLDGTALSSFTLSSAVNGMAVYDVTQVGRNRVAPQLAFSPRYRHVELTAAPPLSTGLSPPCMVSRRSIRTCSSP